MICILMSLLVFVVDNRERELSRDFEFRGVDPHHLEQI